MSSAHNLQHDAEILLMGSCFSDEIGKLLSTHGFEVTVNPGGTLFHPLALAKLLKWALAEQYEPLRVHQREDIFLSWDLSGTFYALSEAEFDMKCQQLHTDLRESLLKITHLIITFGSSWAYLLKQDNEIAANCHKAPKHLFSKELSNIDDMLHCWKRLLNEIKQVNPAIQIILTVSPVKHLKDGLIENNRSKARLHLLTEQLCTLKQCTYFEAFEIVTDQLRDYIYYKEDGAHPNQKAVLEVWNIFVSRYMTASAKQCLMEWDEIQKLKAHRILYPESKEALRYQENSKQKFEAFKAMYPDFRLPTLF